MTPGRRNIHEQLTRPEMSVVRAKLSERAVAVTLNLLEEISHHRMTWTELCAWLNSHLIAPGYLEPPREVREISEGVRLVFPFGGKGPPAVKLQLMLAVVHRTIIYHLTKLAPPEVDDRFLHAAIYKQRIRRVTSDRHSRWVPCPEPTDTLCDWIISFVAADLLTHPEEYEHDLMHCPHCGYVRLQSLADTTHTCRPPPPSMLPDEPPR